MTQKQAIQLFEQRKVRTVWDDDAGKWYVAIVDVVAVLTDSIDAAAYWRKLKQRLKAEGNETVTSCHGLKMPAADGKMRMTDVADTEQLFRLIQSIPSPKAEPFKLWLASLGRERLEELDDPELGIDRMLEYYHRKGYSENWINQRLKSIEVRKELTDEWERRGIKRGQEFATLTDIITQGWSGMTTRQYKRYNQKQTGSHSKHLLHCAIRNHCEHDCTEQRRRCHTQNHLAQQLNHVTITTEYTSSKNKIAEQLPNMPKIIPMLSAMPSANPLSNLGQIGDSTAAPILNAK